MNIFSLGGWTWFWEAINSLCLIVCNWIYSLVGWLYQVFDAVARVNLFDKETFAQITSRMYVVMAVAMLFIFAYNLILMIINPEDKKSTGETTKIVKETIISLVLVILLPTIFNYLYIFQNHILSSNIIGQVILGGVGSTSGNSDTCDPSDYDCTCNFSGYDLEYVFDIEYLDESMESAEVAKALGSFCKDYKNDDIMTDSKRGAFSVAPILISAFYRPTHFTFDECVEFVQGNDSIISDDEDKQICRNYFYDVTASKYHGDIRSFVLDPYLKNIVSDSDKDNMEFNALMAIVAGGLAVYMFFCYAMEIGVRVAKLGVLQIISPIAVMMRIIPKQKEGIYTKWFNQLKNTYLDVFIRLAIIYFALFAISLVPNIIDTLFESIGSGTAGTLIKILSTVFVILGILKFAQEAPGLLKEFFGNAGTFALKSPKKQFSENKLAMGGINALRGGIYGATTGATVGERLGGFFSGAARGAVGGYDKAVKGLDTARTERANGSTFGGRMLDRARVAAGMETRAEADDRRVNRDVETKFNTKARSELNKDVTGRVKNIEEHVKTQLEKGNSAYTTSITDASGNIINGNFAELQRYAQSLQDAVGNATTDSERARLQQMSSQFHAELEEKRKTAVKKAITNLNSGNTSLDGIADVFKQNDTDYVKGEIKALNEIIKEGKVAQKMNDDGKIISVHTTEISTGDDLLGSGGLKDELVSQSTEITMHSQVAHRKDYDKYKANSNIVRGQGKSEKK